MPRLLTALAVTLVFAVLGWAVAGVTLSGAAAGSLVAFALYYGIGPLAFAVLAAVFALTWAVTRIGYARKQRLGVAERRRGRRTASQVLANLAISGACAIFFMVGHHHALLLAAMAALAEAAADTTSSECGEAWSDTAYLLTSFRTVPAGTDGAITLVGTLAGVAAAALIAALATAVQLVSTRAALVVALAGILGALFDSLLGATLERRGFLTNNGVNFLGTLFAAVVAATLASV